MHRTFAHWGAVFAGIGLFSLAACDTGGEGDAGARALDLSGPTDPALYAGDVQFHIEDSVPTKFAEVPFAVSLGLAPEGETRLRGAALVDLRDMQQQLPELLTRSLEPRCAVGLDIRTPFFEAVGETLHAAATIDARLYRCRDRDAGVEGRGLRLLTQTIDVNATLRAELNGECISFHLDAVDLAPKGVIGGIATLLGLTNRGQTAILTQAEVFLSEHQVCPKLPPELELLAPEFDVVSLQEIGRGGIGAHLIASVSLESSQLVEVTKLAQSSRSRVADRVTQSPRPFGQAAFQTESTLDVGGQPVDLGLELDLAAQETSRIDVDAMLDLRDLQQKLPGALEGRSILDMCAANVVFQEVSTDADEKEVTAAAQVKFDSYNCERTGPGSWERGTLRSSTDLGARAAFTVALKEACVIFELRDLRGHPDDTLFEIDIGGGRFEAARELMVDAIGLVLEEYPICPDLPVALLALSPEFEEVTPQEVGDNGLGAALKGSVDVSPSSVIAMLQTLQNNGTLPPAP